MIYLILCTRFDRDKTNRHTSFFLSDVLWLWSPSCSVSLFRRCGLKIQPSYMSPSVLWSNWPAPKWPPHIHSSQSQSVYAEYTLMMCANAHRIKHQRHPTKKTKKKYRWGQTSRRRDLKWNKKVLYVVVSHEDWSARCENKNTRVTKSREYSERVFWFSFSIKIPPNGRHLRFHCAFAEHLTYRNNTRYYRDGGMKRLCSTSSVHCWPRKRTVLKKGAIIIFSARLHVLCAKNPTRLYRASMSVQFVIIIIIRVLLGSRRLRWVLCAYTCMQPARPLGGVGITLPCGRLSQLNRMCSFSHRIVFSPYRRKTDRFTKTMLFMFIFKFFYTYHWLILGLHFWGKLICTYRSCVYSSL